MHLHGGVVVGEVAPLLSVLAQFRKRAIVNIFRYHHITDGDAVPPVYTTSDPTKEKNFRLPVLDHVAAAFVAPDVGPPHLPVDHIGPCGIRAWSDPIRPRRHPLSKSERRSYFHGLFPDH